MRVRPYLFYDVAVSICATCYRKVEGKIVFEDGSRLHDQAVPGTRHRARADGRRRRVLPALPRGVHQAAGDARALQHAGALRLPLRLRAVQRSRAALLPVPRRDQRSLQPAVPDLLRGQRTAPAAAAIARPGPRHDRCGRPQRGASGRRADLRRRADAAPAVLRHARLREARTDPPPDGEHQRDSDRAGRRVRRAPRRLHAGLRAVPAVRLVRTGRADGPPRRGPPADSRAGAGPAESSRHLDHAGRHGEERASTTTSSARSWTTR